MTVKKEFAALRGSTTSTMTCFSYRANLSGVLRGVPPRNGLRRDVKQPERALEAIRRTETVYDPQWDERNPSFIAIIDKMYAEYYRAAGQYDRALELFYRNLRFDEEATVLPPSWDGKNKSPASITKRATIRPPTSTMKC